MAFEDADAEVKLQVGSIEPGSDLTKPPASAMFDVKMPRRSRR